MSKQVIELQQKVKTLIDTGSNEIIKKNEVSLDAAMKKIDKDISENKVAMMKIDKDLIDNKVELTDGMMKMDKAMSEIKVEVNS